MVKCISRASTGDSGFEGVQIVLYGTDTALLERLQRSSDRMPYISVQPGYGPEAVRNGRLDALWATPMVGVELFGATPPFVIHEACIVETPTQHRDRGMPRYGVVGVATNSDDPTTPEFVLRLVLSAFLRAVRAFNAAHDQGIGRVGFLPEDLRLGDLDADRALVIIREAFEAEGLR
ncbi:MAG: hypothetical protein JNL98_40435 [Bryobacterales bacterium]|nr:hypothetical protein [Bryobacterales bacterium]